MKLSQFIIDNLDDILEEWEDFAATIPGSGAMDRRALQDHARGVLEAIARNMNDQSGGAHGEPTRDSYRSASDAEQGAAGARHATDRLSYGFTVHQLMAEFQALRLSVMRRWAHSVNGADRDSLEQLVAFNKGIDDAVMESVAQYTSELSTAREIFLGVVGHDLRSPLGAMKMSAAMIENDEQASPRQRRLAARIGQSGQRVEKMLADLMDMARTRMGGSMPLSRRNTDLRAIGDEVLAEVQAANPDVDLRERFDGDLRGCWDGERLIQLLMNLLTNAIKHGAISRPVSLWACDAGQRVRVEVHNEGKPIPEGLKRSIFEPFVAARRDEELSAGEAGVGLGLYICKVIVEAHGGEIDVDSSPQAGTTFCVLLPRAAPPERADDQGGADPV